MTEKVIPQPRSETEGTNTNSMNDASDIKLLLFDVIGRIILPILLENLNLQASISGLVRFGQIEYAIGYLYIEPDTTITIMHRLKDAGFLEYAAKEGWYIVNPPWLVEREKQPPREPKKRMW